MRKQSTADRLKQIMSEKNLKQVDIIERSKPFQEKLGVKLGKSALSQYVNGVQSPDQHKLTLLSLTLDVSEAWLMGYDVPMHRNTSNEEQEKFYFEDKEVNVEELANSAMTFDGKPLTDEDKRAIQNIIEIYLRGRG